MEIIHLPFLLALCFHSLSPRAVKERLAVLYFTGILLRSFTVFEYPLRERGGGMPFYDAAQQSLPFCNLKLFLICCNKVRSV